MKKPFNRAIRILLVTNSLILVASAMMVPIFAIFVEEIGGDILAASFTFATFSLVAGVATLLSGKHVDKIGNNKLVMITGYSIIAFGFFSLTLVNSVLGLLIVQVVIGLGNAIYAPAFDASFSKHLNMRKAGREWGVWEATNYFTYAIGAVVGGILVASFGFDVMFVAMGLLCLASAVYMSRLSKRIL